MHKFLNRTVLLTLGLVIALPAAASDWYVDAVNGSNANGGTSWPDAWQTISHANSQVPSHTGGVIFIAAGLYDLALGESFPLYATGRSYVGVDGSAVTILDAAGAPSSVVSVRVGDSYLYLTGLTLTGANFGIDNYVPDYESYTLDLTDVQITATGTAVRSDLLEGYYDLRLDHVVLHGNQQGLFVSHVGHLAATDLVATDCLFDANANYGVHVRIAGPGSYSDTFWHRCRFLDNGGAGVELVGDVNWAVGVNAWVYDSLIAGNTTGVTDDWGYARLEGCTVANNAVAGVFVGKDASSVLLGTILYGNADDLVPLGRVSASFCDIGDGDFAGSNNNFSADPLFLDAPNRDYRPTFGSPCVDTGVLDLAQTRSDLGGTPRDLDGDLNGETAVDVGAFELAPLALVGEPSIGSIIELQLWGPQGGSSRVFAHRGIALDPPLGTPFGDLYLDRGRLLAIGSSLTAPGPPGSLFWNVPNDPNLVGLTVTMQALSASGDPLKPWGLTNAVEIVFER